MSVDAPGSWSIETIDPLLAESLLEAMVANRNASDKRVKQYAAMLSAGHWRITHEGIAIHDNRLVDGQHRMLAVIASNVPMVTWVYRSFSGESYMPHINRGKPRSDYDIATVSGYGLNSTDISIVRVLDHGQKAFTSIEDRDPESLIDRIERHADTLWFVRSCGFSTKVKGLTQAMFSGAIGRASLIYGRDVMTRFCEIYFGACPTPKETAASRLREFALLVNGGAGNIRRSSYRKAASACKAFAAGRPLTKLYEPESEEEPLPLPQPPKGTP